MRALVIGGGVSGLTTAAVLLEQGWEVEVVAQAWAPDIVSSVAAAIWHPFRAEHPKVAAWAHATLERLSELAQRPEAGVQWVRGCQLHRVPTERPSFTAGEDGYRPLAAEALPEGFVCGFAFSLPVIETPVYMGWLRGEVLRLGGSLRTATLASLDEALAQAPLVVNCTGLGARSLVGDQSLTPIRGQIVRIEPGLVAEFFFDEDEAERPIYLIPRSDGTIVGGTTLSGDWDTEVRPATTAQILERATQNVPAIRDAEILEVLVGLRPGRPTIRLEAEQQGEGWVIHNYGHGGSGFTLSWGCAEEVAELAREASR